MPRRADHLALYEAAVQRPEQAVALIERIWRHGRPRDAGWPALLREDFAGTCSIAAAWVSSDAGRGAVAVEHDEATLRWAEARHTDVLAHADLHLVHADVLDFAGPRVDAVCAFNFTLGEWHDRAALLAYLKHVRKRLRPGGVFVADLYGGPGAERLGTQSRPFDHGTYHWTQAAFDPLTRRTRCEIRFTPRPRPRKLASHPRPRKLADRDRDHHPPAGKPAFTYDWRLWTPPELGEALRDAGFADVACWGQPDPTGDGALRPLRRMPIAPRSTAPEAHATSGGLADAWLLYAVGRVG